MKRILFSLSLLIVFACVSCKRHADHHADSNISDQGTKDLITTGPKISVPLGGNAFITKKGAHAEEVIDKNGLSNWIDTSSVISVYFRLEHPGTISLSMLMKVSAGTSKIKVSVGARKPITMSVSNTTYDTVSVGNFEVAEKGYVKVDIQGISKTGNDFGEISHLIVSGLPVKYAVYFVKDNLNDHYYWGRRGPSVHLAYIIPEKIKNEVEWFYNEVNVLPGMDPEGSYFQSNGFKEGYFGIQVNSATERRILFSIWSPFTTDDPSAIPEDKKIKLLKKGAGVTTGEFGDEGSGGQSYLVYPWTAGKTYAFLTRAQPNTTTHKTVYTSYFKPTGGNWMLIASFERPATSTRLKGLYSFVENFNPEMGYLERKANYANQWVVDTNGTWTEITTAKFTGDDIASKAFRKDAGGGQNGNQFYLRNGGFFNDFTVLKQNLTRTAGTNAHPVINFKNLP